MDWLFCYFLIDCFIDVFVLVNGVLFLFVFVDDAFVSVFVVAFEEVVLFLFCISIVVEDFSVLEISIFLENNECIFFISVVFGFEVRSILDFVFFYFGNGFVFEVVKLR